LRDAKYVGFSDVLLFVIRKCNWVIMVAGGVQTADTGASLSRQVAGEFSSVLCRLVNGTCLSASRCVTSGITSALYSRALDFRCNRDTVCCLG